MISRTHTHTKVEKLNFSHFSFICHFWTISHAVFHSISFKLSFSLSMTHRLSIISLSLLLLWLLFILGTHSLWREKKNTATTTAKQRDHHGATFLKSFHHKFMYNLHQWIQLCFRWNILHLSDFQRTPTENMEWSWIMMNIIRMYTEEERKKRVASIIN